MAQEGSSQRRELRFGLHIHFYVSMAIVALCVGAFLVASLGSFRDGKDTVAMVEGLSSVVAFVALLTLTARYCSNDQVSYWDGLRLAAHYSSIGIGAISLLLSILSITVLILVTFMASLAGVVVNNRQWAQYQMLRFLNVLGRHRMYQ